MNKIKVNHQTTLQELIVTINDKLIRRKTLNPQAQQMELLMGQILRKFI